MLATFALRAGAQNRISGKAQLIILIVYPVKVKDEGLFMKYKYFNILSLRLCLYIAMLHTNSLSKCVIDKYKTPYVL